MLDAPAVFGIGVIPSAMARIADVRWRAVRHDPEAVIGLMALQILTCKAFPAIVPVWYLNPATSICLERRCDCNATRSRIAATVTRKTA